MLPHTKTNIVKQSRAGSSSGEYLLELGPASTLQSVTILSHGLLSKPNVTQLNSTQLKQLKSNFVGLDIVLTWNPRHHHGHSLDQSD